jgi:acyl-CoA dehydrogenase
MIDFDDDAYLDDDLRDMRDAVAKLCEKFPDTYWQHCDRERAYPEAFADALREGGWLSVLVPEEYGGGGMDIRAAAVILQAVNRSGGNATSVHAQMYTMSIVTRHGDEVMKQRFLPRIASGELRMQSMGLTEPEAGSETTKLRTRAERRGDHYVVNGQKIFISRFFHTDLLLLLARTTPYDQVKRKTDGISAFIVEVADLVGPGKPIEAHPIATMVNHETVQLFLTDLEVPAENLIGEEGMGFRYLMSGLNAERLIVASEHVGGAFWFLDWASSYANERVVFDRPIGQNQGVQFPLAEAYMETCAASLFRWHGMATYERGGSSAGYEATAAKYLSSMAQWKAANAAMDTFGGYGMAEEYGIERRFRESRLALVAPVNNNIVRSFVATEMLQLPRSY